MLGAGEREQGGLAAGAERVGERGRLGSRGSEGPIR